MFKSKITKSKLTNFLTIGNVVLSLLPLYLFVIIDRRIWAFDLSDYGIQSLRLAERLAALDFSSWFHLLFNQEYFGKAPLMVWIQQFPSLFMHLNINLKVILLVNQLMIVCLSVFIGHKIIKDLYKNSNGFLFMYIFLGITLINGVAKSNYVENLQFLIISLSIYLSLYLRRNNVSKPVYFSLTFSTLALIFLVKANTFIFCWPFILLIANEYKRTKKTNLRDQPLITFVLVFCSLMLLYLTSAWYFYNFSDVVKHAYDSTSDLWSYKSNLMDRISSVFFNILQNSYALIVLVPIALFAWFTRRDKKFSNADLIQKLLVLTILSVFVYYLVADNSDPRLLYPFYGLTSLLLSLLFANSDRTIKIFAFTIAVCCFWYVNIATLQSDKKIVNNHAFTLESSPTNELDMKKVLTKFCSDANQTTRILLTYISPNLSESAWDFEVLQLILNGEIPKRCKVDSIESIQGEKLSIESVTRSIEDHYYTVFIDATENWKIQNPNYTQWILNQNNQKIMSYIRSKYSKIKVYLYHKEWLVIHVEK